MVSWPEKGESMTRDAQANPIAQHADVNLFLSFCLSCLLCIPFSILFIQLTASKSASSKQWPFIIIIGPSSRTIGSGYWTRKLVRTSHRSYPPKPNGKWTSKINARNLSFRLKIKRSSRSFRFRGRLLAYSYRFIFKNHSNAEDELWTILHSRDPCLSHRIEVSLFQ